MVNNPHDTAFRTAFHQKDLAVSFFQHYLSKRIVRTIDFGTLKIIKGSYVDEAFVKSRSDIVYRGQLKGKDVFLYILFEHQSTPDQMMFRKTAGMPDLVCPELISWRRQGKESKPGKSPDFFIL